jgi:tRNA nucleotidyltransferase (CCA-adding enzyme)
MGTSISNWNWVTPDRYVSDIFAREAVATGVLSPVWLVLNELRPHIQEWANRFLAEMHPSGSFMKGTCNKSGTDVDLFISLSPNTAESLSEIHDKLCKFMTGKGYKPRPQNVSVNISVAGHSVDLVPGKLQNLLSADHSLYRRKADTWTKTNVQTHIEAVRSSNRLSEIRILKPCC